MEELKLDCQLPEYLQHDILAYIKACNEDDINWDLYWGELYGSINMAMSSGQISQAVADELRNYYLTRRG